MIEIKNVTKKYKNIVAVDNLSLTINDGEIFGLIGPDDTGKTSLIEMIVGASNITEGNIIIDNININDKPVDAKMKIGFVPANQDIFLQLKGKEYINFISNIFSVDPLKRNNIINNLINLFDMENLLNTRIAEYSNEMKENILIIGSLLHDPKNLILDEPIKNLQIQSIQTLKDLLFTHSRKNNVVLLSTNDLEFASKTCDRIGIINKGKLIYCGTFNELKERYQDLDLESLFVKVLKDYE